MTELDTGGKKVFDFFFTAKNSPIDMIPSPLHSAEHGNHEGAAASRELQRLGDENFRPLFHVFHTFTEPHISCMMGAHCATVTS